MSDPQLRILLVDDDEMVRDCISAYLEDDGFTVHSATSAEEALLVLPDFRPAVCITDMRLPGMTGETFILHAHKLTPEVHFLLHTGGSFVLSDPLRSIGMVADDVLYKPLHELSLLSRRIRSLSGSER